MPNLRDIADELNVSISLVSKVLSGRLGNTGASQSTVQAIQIKAEQMGYRKNRTAAALATGRQNTLGVFLHRVGTTTSGMTESFLAGVCDAAAAGAQRLTLQFFSSSEEFRSFARDIHRNVMDGMIIGGIAHRDLVPMLRQIHELGLPIVTTHDEPLDKAFPNIACDQVLVGRLATAHLIECGCRRLATFRTSHTRHQGYLSALADAGIPVREKLVVPVQDFDYEAGEAGMQKLLATRALFDGLVVHSDAQALGAFNVMTRRGIRVPEDVRVVGIDNSPVAPFNLVPLTSVSQEDFARGREAVRMLLNAVGGKTISSVLLEPVVHIRASTRPEVSR